MMNGAGPGSRAPRPPVTTQQIVLLAILGLSAVGVAWACAWGVRG